MSNQGKGTISTPNEDEDDKDSPAVIVLMWVGGLFVLFIFIALYKYWEYANPFQEAIMPSTRIPTRYGGYQFIPRASNKRTGTLVGTTKWVHYQTE